MKLVLFFALIIASVSVFADQTTRTADQALPTIEKRMYEPRRAPPIAAAPPRAPEPQPSNDEIINLLRAQTTAIKSMSSKLDSLEERIGKIEKGQH